MANTLYIRTTPELKSAVVNLARENRRKVNAQLELMIEEWLTAHNVRSTPVASDAGTRQEPE